MSNELKVGRQADLNAGRDAIHIAIAPVIARETTSPGKHVGIVGHTDEIQMDGSVVSRAVVSVHAVRTIGIIDPFLTKDAAEGQRIWLFIYPNQIRSLTHLWTHPAFDKNCPAEPVAFVPEGLIAVAAEEK